MQRFLTFALILGLALAAGGCGGEKKLQTKGRLLKSGQALAAPEGEFFHVIFVPIPPDGKPAADQYVALVDQAAGTFTVAGKDLKGVPPGKYRVAVEWMKKKKDQLRGKFDTVNSPFKFDVDSSTKEIVIDLDKPPTA
ncbi:MAG: hypothetical protein ACLQNE_18075 [Thermoguttaceae bacterium]